jgi:hypothetical protein
MVSPPPIGWFNPNQANLLGVNMTHGRIPLYNPMDACMSLVMCYSLAHNNTSTTTIHDSLFSLLGASLLQYSTLWYSSNIEAGGPVKVIITNIIS